MLFVCVVKLFWIGEHISSDIALKQRFSSLRGTALLVFRMSLLITWIRCSVGQSAVGSAGTVGKPGLKRLLNIDRKHLINIWVGEQ